MNRNKVATKTQLYREYNKYVTSINKQLRALEKEIPDSVAISRYKGEFLRLKTTKGYTRQDVIKLHAKARELAESGRLDVENVKRARMEAINTFHRWGYSSVNDNNVDKLFDLLERLRQQGIIAQGGSGQILRNYKKQYKQGKITDENLKRMLDEWL